MRFLRVLFLALLTVILLTLALTNRDPVALRLLPEGLSGALGLGLAIELPLFVVIYAAILLGVFIGFVWEWLREHKFRAAAQRSGREAKALQAEVTRLRSDTSGESDEIIALLDAKR